MLDYAYRTCIFEPKFDLIVYEGFLKKSNLGVEITTRTNEYIVPREIIRYVKYGVAAEMSQVGLVRDLSRVENIGGWHPKSTDQLVVQAPFKYFINSGKKVTLRTPDGDIYDFFKPNKWVFCQKEVEFCCSHDEMTEDEKEYRKALLEGDYNLATAIRRHENNRNFMCLNYD